MGNDHIIHQLIAELTLSLESSNYSDANHEIEEYQNIIIETVTHFFNQLDVEENIFIEEIELQLETVNSKDEFKIKLIQQLEFWQQNNAVLSNFKTGSYSVEKSKSSITKITDNLSINDILSFLQTGSFSWELLEKKQQEILRNENTIASLKYFFETQNTEKTLSQLISNPNIFLRLMYYFPAIGELVLRKIILFKSDDVEVTSNLIHHFTQLFSKNELQFHPEIWKQFFLKIHQIVFKFKNEISLQLFLILIIQTKQLNYSISERQFQISEAELLEKHNQIILEFLKKNTITFNISKDLIFKNLQQIFLENSFEKFNNDSPNQFSVEPETQKNIPFLYRNCGIILIHPFLPILFNEFKLLEERIFSDFSKQVKAVQILSYLSTSDDYFNEKEIHFFKLMVGLKPDDFVHWKKPLTAEEKKSCEEVLNILIKEWSILKNTSISTLQAQFLQRKGVAEEKEKSIEIRWQKNALDILLDHLPYNYSIVKLPWLNKLLIMLDSF